MKLPYSEGTVFFVPLRNGGYARGVVARASSKGKVLFGCFFGPRLSSHELPAIGELDFELSVLNLRFSDLGLINGEWRIACSISNWNRSFWPMPEFVRRDPLGRIPPIRVCYSDDDPSRIQSEAFASEGDLLEPELIAGYGSVEIKLTKLFG